MFNKRRIMAAVLAIGSLAGLAGTARADIRNFYVVNNSSNATIISVWYAHPGDPYWSPMQLSSLIGPGTRAPVEVDMPNDPSCVFDIKVQFNDNDVQTGRVNLCRTLYVVAH